MTAGSLKLVQSQQLNITSHLIQSINLLQMTNLELESVVNKELQENPFLSISDTNHAKDEYDNYNYTINLKGSSKKTEDLEQEGYFEATSVKSLREYMEDQIKQSSLNNIEKIIATQLMQYLSPTGYLSEDLNIISRQIIIPIPKLEKLLVKLQNFEPAGVFARNLAECLKLQLIDRGVYNHIFAGILDNIEILAEANFRKLANICNCSIDEITKCVKVIKTLNPKPGNNYSNDITEVKIPDVFIRKNSQDEWLVELNQENIPKILLKKDYYNSLCKRVTTKEDKQFLNERYTSATNLISAIEQRALNILKITQSMIKYQSKFFKQGVMYLKPMKLSDIAKEVGVNESTVSRVVNSKYISTPYGVFQMKYFFSSGYNNSISGDISSTKIKEIIKGLVDSEKENILSDEELVQELAKFKITVARRTISKYREALKIPPSNIRKRQKLLEIV